METSNIGKGMTEKQLHDNAEAVDKQPPKQILSSTTEEIRTDLSDDSAVMKNKHCSQKTGVNYLNGNENILAMNKKEREDITNFQEKTDKIDDFCDIHCDDYCNDGSVDNRSSNGIANPTDNAQPSAESIETKKDNAKDGPKKESSQNDSNKPLPDLRLKRAVVFEIKHMTLFDFNSMTNVGKKSNETMHWLFTLNFEYMLYRTVFALGYLPQQRTMYLWDTNEKLLRILDDEFMRRIRIETEHFRLATLSLCTRLFFCEVRSMHLAGEGFFCDRDDQVKCFSCGAIFDTANADQRHHYANCCAIEDTSETIAEMYGATALTNFMLENAPIEEEREISLRSRDNGERMRLGNTSSMHQTMRESQPSNPSSALVISPSVGYVRESDLLQTDAFPVPCIVQQPRTVSQPVTVLTNDYCVTHGATLSTVRPRISLSSSRISSFGNLPNTAIGNGATSSTNTVSLANSGRQSPSYSSRSVVSASQRGKVAKDSDGTTGAICRSVINTSENNESCNRYLRTGRTPKEKNNELDVYPPTNSRCNVTNMSQTLTPPMTCPTNCHSKPPLLNAESNLNSKCSPGKDTTKELKTVKIKADGKNIVSRREKSPSAPSGRTSAALGELEGIENTRLDSAIVANKKPDAEHSAAVHGTKFKMAARKPKFKMSYSVTASTPRSESQSDLSGQAKKAVSQSYPICQANNAVSRIEKESTRRNFRRRKDRVLTTTGSFTPLNHCNKENPVPASKDIYRRPSRTDREMVAFGLRMKNEEDDRDLRRTVYSTLEERILSFHL